MRGLVTLALLGAVACGPSYPNHPSRAGISQLGEAGHEAPEATHHGSSEAPVEVPPPVEVPVVPEHTAPTEAPPVASGGDPVAGEAVYKQYCQACHQADGKGMNGALAANFVDDKSRLDKPDEELLKIIANGTTGKVGTMPAWGAILNETQRKDALAYVRKTFGQ